MNKMFLKKTQISFMRAVNSSASPRVFRISYALVRVMTARSKDELGRE